MKFYITRLFILLTVIFLAAGLWPVYAAASESGYADENILYDAGPGEYCWRYTIADEQATLLGLGRFPINENDEDDPSGLTGQLKRPEKLGGYPLAVIGKDALRGFIGLTSVIIPEGVLSIGDNAFLSCSSLTSVNIPDSVLSIGDRAFYNCSSLASVIIPKSVTYIGDDAFSGCGKLTLTVSEGSYAALYAARNNIPFILE
jgi:hypothetical protein